MQLTPEVEADFYRLFNPDLRHLDEAGLLDHYARHGKSEGRLPNRLKGRSDFVAMMGQDARILEIGPFTNPLAAGENVSYADWLDRSALVARATALGIEHSRVPEIRYVLSQTPLEQIPESFDFVLSSHAIEHQPNLVKHLQDVYNLVKYTGGKYFLLIPDKRYCFDRFISESTIADVLDAYYGDRTVHSLKSVVEHRALMVHNDAHLHWNAPQAVRPEINVTQIEHAVNEWCHAQGGYIDVHAWYFTPESFREIVGILKKMRLIDFELEIIYSTRHGENEFWAVLSG